MLGGAPTLLTLPLRRGLSPGAATPPRRASSSVTSPTDACHGARRRTDTRGYRLLQEDDRHAFRTNHHCCQAARL